MLFAVQSSPLTDIMFCRYPHTIYHFQHGLSVALSLINLVLNLTLTITIADHLQLIGNLGA